MSRTSTFLVVLALLLEATSWGSLLGFEEDALRLPGFLLLHGMASVSVAAGLQLALGTKRGGPAAICRAVLFMLAFFIPFAGLPGLVVCMALYRPPPGLDPSAHESFGVPPLPLQARPHRADLLSADFNLEAIIRGARDSGRRLNALLSASRLPDELGVPLLAGALKDRDDEVRLLAHALLAGKERGLYGAISTEQAALSHVPASEQARLHTRLACHHWALVDTGLASGEVASHLLAEALGHAELARGPEGGDAGLELLIGRIHLRRGDAAAAGEALTRALERGLAPALVLPYLAEAAFLAGRTDELTARARSLRQLQANPSPLTEFWS